MTKSLKNLKSPKSGKPNHKKYKNVLEDLLTDFASSTSQDISSIANSMKKIAESQIKKNESVAKLTTAIFDFLFQPGSNVAKSEAHATEAEPTLSYATGVSYTKDDVLQIIKKMREERATYLFIAEYLQEKKIPTFSGRGRWHAQTIQRFCKDHNLAPKFTERS